MLKFCVGVLFLIALVTISHANEDSELEAECANEIGVDVENANEVLEAEMMKGGEVPENMKCYARCVLAKKGVFYANGEFNDGSFISALSNGDRIAEMLISEALETCKLSLPDTTSCNFAYSVLGCILNEIVKKSNH